MYVSCSMKPQTKLPRGPTVRSVHSSGADALGSVSSPFLCSQVRLPRKIFNKEFSDWETVWEGLVLVCFMLLLPSTVGWRANKRNSFLTVLEARKSSIMQVWHHTDSELTGILLHQHSMPKDDESWPQYIEWSLMEGARQCVMAEVDLCCTMLFLGRREQTSSHLS